MEVIIDADCGNAPKKLQVRDWLVAVASADTAAAGSLLTDDVVCDLASGDAVTGRAGVLDALVGRPARELVVSNLLSHGKHVAAEGRITREGAQPERFACFLTYTGHGKAALVGNIVWFDVVNRPA